MAEGEGFEPPVRFPVHRFSRPTVSTTHTSLRVGNASGSIPVYTAAKACTLSPCRFSNTLSAYHTRQRFSFTIGEPALQ
jgi:hypothetical protein